MSLQTLYGCDCTDDSRNLFQTKPLNNENEVHRTVFEHTFEMLHFPKLPFKMKIFLLRVEFKVKNSH